MKENLTLAWVAAWFALAGQLLFFIGVSFYTGEWRYVMWSFIVSMTAGVPSIIQVRKATKAADTKKVKTAE